MKNLKNLNGAKALSKNEQKSINGGKNIFGIPPNGCGSPRSFGGSGAFCNNNSECPKGEGCFIESEGYPLVAHCHCL